MLSSDKRANLSPGLLGAKETPAGGTDATPTASLFALPRGGARQRLLEQRGIDGAVQDDPPASEPEASAPELVPLAAAKLEAVKLAPAKAAGETNDSRPRDSLLATKGDASASGFRPWYWSYERDGSPLPSDSAGTVTPFPAGAPAPINPPDPVGAPATSPPISEAPAPILLNTIAGDRPQRGAKLALLMIGCFSATALAGSATLFLLSRAPTSEAPKHVAIAEQPMPLPKPPEIAPQRPVVNAAPPQEAAKPAEAPPAPAPRAPSLSPQEQAELITRGDQMLATGDIAAGRLFYERAAEGGSAVAATAAGRTYDPLFLNEVHARGIRGDPVAAARWYRRASAGGDRQADALMKRLMAKFAG